MEFKEVLFDRVYSSRNNSINKIAAANAITILNRAKVVFSGMDLSQIIIPEADLSYALLANASLTGADLQGVNLNQAYLSDTDLSNCKMNDIELGQLPFLTHENSVRSICFSSNGHYMAVGSSLKYKEDLSYDEWDNPAGIVIVWDIKTATQYARFVGHEEYVRQLSFNPNDSLLLSVDSYSLRLWNIKNRELIYMISKKELGHYYSVEAAFFDVSGNSLISVSKDVVRYWDITHRNNLQQLIDLKKNITLSQDEDKCMLFTPDGKFLAISNKMDDEYSLSIFNIELIQSSDKPLVLLGCKKKITSVTFSLDGRLLATGSVDQMVRLWDMTNLQLLGKPMMGHTSTVTHLVFSSDKKLLVSTSDDNSIRIWSVEQQIAIGQALIGHTQSIHSIIFSPDCKLLVSGSSDKTARLWKVEYFTSNEFIGKDSNRNSHSITSCQDKTLIAVSSVSNANSTLDIYDIINNSCWALQLKGFVGIVRNAIISPNKKILAITDENEIVHLWDVINNKRLEQDIGKQDFTPLIFSPDNKLLINGNYSDEINQHLLKKPDGFLYGAFSHNGKLLAYGNDSTKKLILWDVENQKPIEKMINAQYSVLYISSVAFSSDDHLLAAGIAQGYNLILLWNVMNHNSLGKEFKGHTKMITSISFSSNGEILASGSNDNTLRLWSVSQQTCLRIYQFTQQINNILFSSDDKYFSAIIGNAATLWQKDIKRMDSYYLVRYFGALFFAAEKLNLTNVQGLSETNSLIFTQNGAMNNKDEKIDSQVAVQSSYLNKKEANTKQSDSTSYSPTASSLTLFKSAADSKTKEDIKQKTVSADKKDTKTINNKNEVYEKEKCRMM